MHSALQSIHGSSIVYRADKDELLQSLITMNNQQ